MCKAGVVLHTCNVALGRQKHEEAWAEYQKASLGHRMRLSLNK